MTQRNKKVSNRFTNTDESEPSDRRTNDRLANNITK